MINDQIDTRKFDEAKLKVLTKNHDPHGFGTLQEKTVHAVMKQYYLPNEDYHEVPINGYIADIYTGSEIIEIQNGNFGHMRDKLTSFLPEYPVYLVYPFPHKKWINWINPETGELISRNRSPITGTIYHALPEFFKIKSFLADPNLHIRVPLIDIDEYRLMDGTRSKKNKKIGSHRYDRVPIELHDEIIIDSIYDYIQLFPITLPDEFTSKDFAKHAKINISLAQEALKLTYDLGIVARIGKEKNAYLYKLYEQ